jgi:DNA-binding MarR family transcriptional regulator
MDTPQLIELIKHFDTFQEETGSSSLREFSVWLNRITNRLPAKATNSGNDNRMIVWLTHRLSKLFRWYAKGTLNANGLTSMDEYFFLISINRLGTPSKTEVYADTITELNTGTQMMKRLIGAGLIEEVIDKKDKRVRRVKLTPKGKKTKEHFFNQTIEDLKLKAGNISATEKQELIRLLAYLEQFHSNIYFNDPHLSFKELAKKHLIPE